MLSKSEKIWIKSLKDKKIRQLQKQFIAEGSRIVLDLIKETPQNLKLLCATSIWIEKYEPLLDGFKERTRVLSDSELQAVSNLKSTEEVLAIFAMPEFNEEERSVPSLIIYLDQIRDPGNLGTIIRSADWFGLKQLYCSPDCVDPFNNKTVQATMSSILRVQVMTKNWMEMQELFPGMDKYAAAADGKNIYEMNKGQVNFICIGNEANGLSPEVINQCKMKISIPSSRSLGAESLNASVACSLIMAWKMFG